MGCREARTFRPPIRARLWLRLREGGTVLYRFRRNPCLSLSVTTCCFPLEGGPFLHETPASAICHLAVRIGMGVCAPPDQGHHRKGQA